MKQPASREVLDPLIDWADVVVENFSPGTMEKLGLDYPRLAARNPGLVMVSGSVFGQTGPLAQSWGVDGTGAALERPHAADRLAGSRSGDSERGALWRRHRAVRHGRRVSSPRSSIGARRPDAAATSTPRCTSCACSRCAAAFVPRRRRRRAPRQRRSAACSTRACTRPRATDRWIAITFRLGRSSGTTFAHSRWRASARCNGPRRCAAPVVRIANRRRGGRRPAGARHRRRRGAGHARTCSSAIRRSQARRSLVPLEHPLLGAFGHMRTPIDFSRSRPQPFRAPAHRRTQPADRRGALRACRPRASMSCETAGSLRVIAPHASRATQPQGPRLHGRRDRVPDGSSSRI